MCRVLHDLRRPKNRNKKAKLLRIIVETGKELQELLLISLALLNMLENADT